MSPNLSMNPTAPLRNNLNVLATAPCRELSFSRRWTLLWGHCKSFEEADDDLSTLACTRWFRLFGPGANSGASAAKIGHEFSRRHGVSQLYTEGTVQLARCKDACAAHHDLVSSGGFSGGATITSENANHSMMRPAVKLRVADCMRDFGVPQATEWQRIGN